MKRISHVLCVFILIICWHQTVDISQAEFPICTEPGYQGKPDIWGDWVVWHDNRDGDSYNIYGKNISSGEEIQISDSNTAFCPSIHNRLVVWQDKRNGDYDIYCYDLVTRTESPLYIAPDDQVNPSIYGDTVVWRTGQYPSWPEIWGYSISESRAFLISGAPGNKWEPDVFRDVVVWGDYRNDNWDIYGYNLTTNNEFAIATGPAYQRSVAIYGNTVVYENWRSSENQGVGIYNLITQEHAYHPTPGDCEWLDIYDGIVVWGDYRNEGTDIYGYKCFISKEFPIYTEVSWQYSPAIYHGTAVWSDDRDGGFSERDIYAATVPKNLYVDANAFGSNDGVTWADAYNYLQDALAIASRGDNIFVAAGTYKPDQGTNQTLGDRDAMFQLINGVGIYGGFPPGGGQWEDRDLNVHETKLSGDLDSDDGPDFANNGENSYHVVTTSGTNESAFLDGFTITGGNAAEHFGGGMLNEYGSPTVSYCTFSGNWAMLGGGMYNNESNLTLTNCMFSGNGTLLGGGMFNSYGSTTLTNCTFSSNSAKYGGGLWNYESNLTLTNCTFSENSADDNGGGMFNSYGSTTLTNCTFSSNSAKYGGGLWNYESNLTLTNNTFSENSADDNGGGMLNSYGSTTLTNCTFSSNSAKDGGGTYNVNSSPTVTSCVFADNIADANGGGMYNDSGSPTLTNCTFSGNSARDGGGTYNVNSSPTVTSCVFKENLADANGGGMYNESGSPALTNCTFGGNSARDGGGLYNCEGPIINCTIIGNSARKLGGGLYNCDGSISNCIIWNNTARDQGDQFYRSDAITSYSCVQGGSSDQGCISFNPCFVVPGYWDANGTVDDANDDFWVDGDYRLKSRAGRWDPLICTELDSTCDGFFNLLDFAEFARFWHEEGESIPADLDNSGVVDSSDLALLLDNYLTSYLPGAWVFDLVTSPCIDAGDPNSDWLAELWPHDKRINMGAYGGTNQASMSLSNIGNIADLNNDDTVNFGDFAHFADGWQIEEVLLSGDLNHDNHVDIVDVMIVCDNWLWERGGTLNVDLTVDNLWMYQNLPGQTNSNLTANASIRDDPMGNSSYTYEWEFILPSDVNIPPETVMGGQANDTFCSFAAPDCNEPNGISDSGQVFTVKVTVTGDGHGNTGTAQAEFGIALLGDVNNDSVVDVADRSIVTAFYQTGSAGCFSLRDCDLNCDGSVNIIDRSIVTAIWKGTLCQNVVNEPCLLRSPCP
ncbi:MAG: dockerin type I domain-containing protein [Planctomycetota bacterium]